MTAPANCCLFSYPDRALSATFSTAGTPWLTALPLDNLKNRLVSKLARSAGITTAHTQFDMTIPANKVVQMIAILKHNASAPATVKLSFSNVAIGGYELHQSAALPFWGDGTVPAEWAQDDFWGSAITNAKIAEYGWYPDFWYVLPAPLVHATNPLYVRVEIVDTSNPAGYFQLGRCFTGPAKQPQVNMDYGAGGIWKQDALKERSLGGVPQFAVLGQHREFMGRLFV